MSTQDTTNLSIAVRAYAVPVRGAKQHPPQADDSSADIGPSAYTLVFDVETMTDAAQQARIVPYQLRENDALREEGIAYDPLTLTDAERSMLYSYAAAHSLMVRTVAAFVDDVFFPYIYDRNARCIAFNLPFDVSRLAIYHNTSKGKRMRGGFSFQLSADRYRPRVQVKHLNNRTAFVSFAAAPPQQTPRGMRRRGMKTPVPRGSFIDVKTIGAALTGGGHSLASLAKTLRTEHRKAETDEHGGMLTPEYLDYALNDVQVTWECYTMLRDRYAEYGLDTPLERIYSEASIGKASLAQMGIRPLRDLQQLSPELLGIIMSTYYGGRAEVNWRREIARVLYCDFKSMYPTVCILMGLWLFVIAKGVIGEDGEQVTREVQTFLDEVTRDDLQHPDSWRHLTTLVQVRPNDLRVPVRAKYGGQQYSIGINDLTADAPLWFTLADIVAAKMKTGITPQVLAAIRFTPGDMQDGLRPIAIAGNMAFNVDPAAQNFYQRLIDLRTDVKRTQEEAEREGNTERAAERDAIQLALKIMANATSYGIFVELNVSDYGTLQEVMVYGPKGAGFSAWTRKVEEPGRYFHPLLATLITGAARLMLALAEELAEGEEITWAFCDTDSMALARPECMDDADFIARARRVRNWFTALNPYAADEPIFKIEEANFRLDKQGNPTKELAPLHVLAVSAKRYVLFNVGAKGRPVIRKASAHGLGHLRAPYSEKDAPRGIPKPTIPLHKIGVERWQHDVWYRIAEVALAGLRERVDYISLPGFDAPAVSRYAATSPTLVRWFKRYNAGRPYREQVRPFGFLLALLTRPGAFMAMRTASEDREATERTDASHSKRRRKRGQSAASIEQPRAVAPFDDDPHHAAAQCFDRETGAMVGPDWLETYAETLAQYHLHPEAKFGNGDYTDIGFTTRRRIVVSQEKGDEILHIGKEANRWEEQFYLGADPEAQIIYGTPPEDDERLRGSVLKGIRQFGVRKVSRESGVSVGTVSEIKCGKGKPKRDCRCSTIMSGRTVQRNCPLWRTSS